MGKIYFVKTKSSQRGELYESHMQGFTVRSALATQEKQLIFYCQNFPAFATRLRQDIASQTNIDKCDLDCELPIAEINRRVPRGGDIEHLIKKYRQETGE